MKHEHYFKGPWSHTTPKQIAFDIIQYGWKPEKNKNTTYGQGIYLSKEIWGTDLCCSKEDVLLKGVAIIYCELLAAPNELKTFFGDNNDQDDFINYLKEHSIDASRAPSSGCSSKNIGIKNFFLSNGIKAVGFQEHGKNIAVVYDIKIIKIIDKEGLD